MLDDFVCAEYFLIEVGHTAEIVALEEAGVVGCFEALQVDDIP